MNEEMSLKEFIKEPNTVRMITKYSQNLENDIKDLPYVRIGNILQGEQAILYVDSTRLQDLTQILGVSQLDIFPTVLGLLGEPSLEDAQILEVQQQPYLNLRRTWNLSWHCRYRN